MQVRELHHAYAGGRTVLNGVTFEIRKGESVGIIGPNGAGKSTLFHCLCGVVKPRQGCIRVAGLDPAERSSRLHLPSQIGLVFQNSDDQLFCSTVAEDVAFGPLNLRLPAEEVKKRVAEALTTVGLPPGDDRFPGHLSGGEKRRAALAGVLAMNPPIILFDEPSMFLDPRGRRDVIAQLKQLKQTMVIASHDLPLIRATCARTLVLNEGRISADGLTEEILSNQALLEANDLCGDLPTVLPTRA